MLKEIKTRGDIILFIDEIHTLVGAGAAEGAIDARQHPQAHARPWRAPDDRCHHTRRVPQAPGEGRGARASIPEGRGRRAVGGPHHRDPQGSPRALRAAPPGDHHRPGARGSGQPGRPLHLRPLPARQGHRPHRRGRLPAADPSHEDPAGLPRDRERARRGGLPEEGGGRVPGLRGRRPAARPGEGAPRQQGGEGRRDARLRCRPLRRGRRGGHRRGALAVDRHPRLQAHRGGDHQAPPHGGRAPPPGHRPGGGHQGRLPGHPPHPRRPQGPQAAVGFVHIPRPLRCRQDRAGQDPRRVPLRRRAGHDQPRHVRVHGEAHRQPSGGFAPRLRGLRGGWPAHRGRPPQAVLGGAVRRDREGPPGRVQHAPADPGGRPPHRLPGTVGRLPQHRADHDLEPGHCRPAQGHGRLLAATTRPSPTRR